MRQALAPKLMWVALAAGGLALAQTASEGDPNDYANKPAEIAPLAASSLVRAVKRASCS